MSNPTAKSFNLPWHQHEEYWISVYPKASDFSADVSECLIKAGLRKTAEYGFAVRTQRDWKAAWDMVYNGLKHCNAFDDVEVVVMPGVDNASAGITAEYKSPVAMQSIAESLWLGNALMEDRLMCYMQPVISAKDKVFGYESFARVKSEDGTIIGGDRIIAASKILGIEHLIDRHLQVQAIKTFVSSQFDGFLFINFLPGFIHRPAVYLEGLSDTVKNFGVIAKHIVLEFTKSETPRDIMHIKNVCEYGRSRGYSIALDDVSSVEVARKLIPELRPDFVKIDMHLVRRVQEASSRETIRAIAELVHANAGTVIAEGVESEEIYQALRLLDVDLFQGYLFSPPVPVEAALKRNAV